MSVEAETSQAIQGIVFPARFCFTRILLLALCTVGNFGCGKRAHDELRGTWVIQPPQGGGSGGESRETWNIADGKIVKVAGPDGSYEERWTYQLNVPERSKRPAQPAGSTNRIDLFPRLGPPRKGIYKVEEGVLTICFPMFEKTARPKEFEEDSRERILLFTLIQTSDQPSVDMNAPGIEDELKGGLDDPELEGTWVEELRKGRPERFLDAWAIGSGKIIQNGGNQMTYQVDAGQQPKAINITWNHGAIRRGIYKIDDDRLTLCTSLHEGQPRPQEFVAQQNKFEIRTFRRKK